MSCEKFYNFPTSLFKYSIQVQMVLQLAKSRNMLSQVVRIKHYKLTPMHVDVLLLYFINLNIVRGLRKMDYRTKIMNVTNSTKKKSSNVEIVDGLHYNQHNQTYRPAYYQERNMIAQSYANILKPLLVAYTAGIEHFFI